MASFFSIKSKSEIETLAAKLSEEFVQKGSITDLSAQLNHIEYKPLLEEVATARKIAVLSRNSTMKEQGPGEALNQKLRHVQTLDHFSAFINKNRDLIERLQAKKSENPAVFTTEIEKLSKKATTDVIQVLTFLAEGHFEGTKFNQEFEIDLDQMHRALDPEVDSAIRSPLLDCYGKGISLDAIPLLSDREIIDG